MPATTSTDFGATLNAAVQGGYVAQLNGGTYTVTQPIVIHIDSTTQGVGINGGGATLVSQVGQGQPVIQIVVGPGVDIRYLDLSNFTIQGNGQEGDGIQIVADGNERWLYNWNINNVTVQHVGGYGLDVQGSVFEGIVSNSWMNSNALGGALFEHSAGGGQASALRWVGGGASNNSGAGMTLDNGTRDMSVDGAVFNNNVGAGISAMSGITSVTGSDFENNKGDGIDFQLYGNFNNNSFSSAGAQTTGISGYLAGDSSLVGNTSHYTGTGSDPTTLANLTGHGTALEMGNTGKMIAGTGVAVGGAGGDNHTTVTVSSQGMTAPTLSTMTAALTASVATSNGTSALESALKAALAGDTVAHLSGTTYTVTSPIIINLTSSMQGPLGIDLGGAEIVSQVGNGRPVIEIIVAPGVNVSGLTLSNFTIEGNGAEGDGIKIVADGTDRSIHNLAITNVNVEHVGGIGLDVVGNIQGAIFNSWMHGNSQGGARFADSASGGVPSGLQWVGGGFRKNGVAGLILDNGAHDVTVKDAYFVENQGPGINATAGITLVTQTGFENNTGAGAMVGGTSNFVDDTFSTHGPQTAAVAGHLAGGTIGLTGVGVEYYGSGSDPSILANVQGSGTIAVAGSGKIVAGSGITVTGAASAVIPPADTTPPNILSIATSGSGISGGTGTLGNGQTVTFTVNMSESVTVAGKPTLTLNDGGTANYVSGTGSAALTFGYTVQSGQTTPDLSISALALNGGKIADAAGNAANVSVATNYNPAGILKIGAASPLVTAALASDTGVSATDKITSNPSVIGTADAGAVVKLSLDGGASATATADSKGLWTYTPTALADGAHSLAVSETNAGGATGTASLTFTLDRAAPVITEKVASTSTSGPTLAGTGDPNSVVSFTVDGTPLASAATANAAGAWSFTPAGLGAGSHTIVARETDQAGNTGSASLAITVGSKAPVLSAKLTSDTGSSAVDGITSKAGLTGTADPGATVHFTVDGKAVAATAVASSSGAWSYTPSSLANGAHTIVASETNAAGVTGTTSLGFTLDTVAPVLIEHLGTNVLTGTGDANATVHFVIDGQAVSQVATANASGAWSTPTTGLSAGLHVIAATETDLAGNVGTVSQSFNFGASHSVVTEKLVSDTGASSTDGVTSNSALSGTADPNAVLHFTIDGSAVAATAHANASGAWSFTPSGLADGLHSVTAMEIDGSGGSASASLTFALDTHLPFAALTGMTAGNGSVTMTGMTGKAGDMISVYDGNTWMGWAATDSAGQWSFAASASSAVVHSYGVNATNPSGHEGHGSNTLLVGSSASDTLLGGSGSDVIFGNGGNDRITGGGGADKITGGSGSDTFAYNAASDSTFSASDVISDFRHGVDKIDLGSIAGITAAAGLPQFQGNITGTGMINAHSVAFIEAGSNTLVLANTSGSAETVSATDTHAADMNIVLVGVNLGLTATDFHHA